MLSETIADDAKSFFLCSYEAGFFSPIITILNSNISIYIF